jgi:hypothetical protein
MSEKGFFQRLFDLEFKEFVTTRIVSTLYVIAIIVSALFSLGIIIDGFSGSFFTGLIKLIIIAPLTFLLTVISARVILEVVMVIFKISENISLLAEKKPTDVLSDEIEGEGLGK